MTRRAPADDVRRGDIVWVNCDPSVGVEPRKTRTCVVVSNDIANRYGQAITIVPTQAYTKERAERAYMVDLRRPRSALREARVANCSMIMTYDRSRIVRVESGLSTATVAEIDRALRVHLEL
jgi:mRNA interferase MazF